MGSPTTGGSGASGRSSGQPSSPSSPDGAPAAGRLLVVSGPSGAGKSTIVRELLRRRPFRFSVSATTRPARPGEVEGVHYHFVDRTEFERLLAEGAFLEWAEYGGNLYGTLRGPVEEAIESGEDVLLEIEIQGARQIKRSEPDAVTVFVQPPDLDELERRLERRGDTDSQEIASRLAIARQEIADAPEVFDHVVVNDDLERATSEIEDLLSGVRPSERADREHRKGTR